MNAAVAMSKAEELEALDRFIESLPKDSYLRPALTAYRPTMAQDIESDFTPDLTLYRLALEKEKKEYEDLRKEVSALQKQVKELEREKRWLAQQMGGIADSVESAGKEFYELIKRLKGAEKSFGR